MATLLHTEWNTDLRDSRNPDVVSNLLNAATDKGSLFVELEAATGPTAIYVNAAKIRYVEETT